MTKYLSGRHRKLESGITGYTEGITVIDTVGNVGINTDITPSELSVIGNAYISGNLGIGNTNPTTAKITFGNSQSNISGTKGQSSLRLFDEINNFTPYSVYGIGINDDNLFGAGIGVTFLDISANAPNGAIRFFAGSYAYDPTEVMRITSQGFVGIGTDDPTQKLSVEGSLKIKGDISGYSLILSNNFTDYEIVSQYRVLQNIAGFDDATSNLISENVAFNPKRFINLNVLGISTFLNGPILVNTIEPSGTSNQLLQVNGGVYSEGYVGIGVTNPSEKLTVIGNISISDDAIHGTNNTTSLNTDEVSLFSGLSTSLYRFVEFSIQASHQTDFHYTKILALQDGVDAYTTEYASVYNNNSLASYNVKIINGNISLNATPSISELIDYKIYYVATKITPPLI